MNIDDDHIASKIYIIRGCRVMLDSDLAMLYRIETKALKQAVKKNIKRFPEDFMIKLTENEFHSLRSQNVTSKRGGTRYPPFVFTEQGIAMLSSVLNSDRAIEVNIAIMRTFVKMRSYINDYKELAEKIDRLESKYDENFRTIFDVIRKLINHEEKKNRNIIGFK